MDFAAKIEVTSKMEDEGNFTDETTVFIKSEPEDLEEEHGCSQVDNPFVEDDIKKEIKSEFDYDMTLEINESLIVEIGESDLTCPKCKKRFKAKQYLRQHLKVQKCKEKIGTGSSLSCPKCKMEFKAREYLRMHVRLQRCKDKTGTGSIICSTCKTHFKDERNLKNHLMRGCQEKAETEIIACPKCNIQFKEKKYLREHIRLKRCCQESKTFECSKCGCSFQKLSHLLQHNKKNINCQEKILEGIKILGIVFHCSKCLKEFETKKNLIIHEKRGKCKVPKEVPLQNLESFANIKTEKLEENDEEVKFNISENSEAESNI